MFITQGPVDPESPLFVGREAELKQMESWLTHVKCVGSVLGARQTGKTSLLLKLRHRFRGKYAFAFVNFEGIVGADVTKCYSYIAEELLEQLPDVITEMDHLLPSDNRGFLSFLRALSRNSRTVRIVILLDEIGALPAETAIKLAHSIRAVFTNRLLKREYGRYVFILSGATDMLELTTGRTSPLKNVTESIYLDDLSEEETRLLLAKGLAQAGVDPSPMFYDYARHWTNGHPYLTRLVGALLVESGQPPTEETVQAVIEQLLQSEDKNLPHIRRALDNGRPELWDTVKSIVRGTSVPFSRSNATVATLELIGVIRNETGRCQVRNNLYREAIRQWLTELPPSVAKVIPLSTSPRADPPLYRDFEILISDRQDSGYPVHVITSPAGEGEGTFILPFEEGELQNDLDQMESGDTDEAFLADFGTRLFAALFTGDVRARYAESVGLTGRDAGLRIRLRLDPPELQELPWELIRDPEKREFLVLSKRSLMTRYLHVPRSTPPLEVALPLHVLVIIAAPQDLASLDTDDEVERIHLALRLLLEGGTVKISVEPHVTKWSLRDRLEHDAPHILHYIGHGGLSKGRGALILENKRGRSDPLDSRTLGTLLKRSSVRLAVLNACLSARDIASDTSGFKSRRTAFMGVGPALVDAGLGAVVAMQFSIADGSARVFAEDFYAMLARFNPVDECVSRAREALLLEVGYGQPDWATPVLFMRASDGILFKEKRVR